MAAEFKAEPGAIIVQTATSITVDQGGKTRTFRLTEKFSTPEQKKYELDTPPPAALETASPPEGAT